MTATAPLAATALVLGALHSFGPDHLAAVSVFASRRPSWRRAASLGARWAMGHSTTILLVGGLVVLSGLRIPDRFAPVAERLVGVVLIALGLSAMWRAKRLHAHVHSHDGSAHWHVHSHAESEAHDHAHGALFGIGMLHGLAGTGALVALLPSYAETRAGGILFLVVFGVGTVCSMALFGATAGHLFSLTTRRELRFERLAVAGAGVASLAVGIWWLTTGGI
ncbi:MAG TPA: sulfite exporter TauE/SafE family protein [Gemmatimonadaceae bacterium]|nr:sulfite exporter TauE/SafE family protein [Gemmatimonadaceae bacterium]